MNNTELFIVYKTDAHHSYGSRDIIGIATDQRKATAICIQQATKEGEEIGGDQIFNLDNLMQTQGYAGKGEFQFEEMKTNVLL